MIKTKQVTKEETEYYCDICGKQTHPHSCECCGRCVCNDCSELDYQHSDDYPDYYCKKCWVIGEPFRQETKKIEEDSDLKQEKLKEEWFNKAKEESLKSKN